MNKSKIKIILLVTLLSCISNLHAQQNNKDVLPDHKTIEDKYDVIMKELEKFRASNIDLHNRLSIQESTGDKVPASHNDKNGESLRVYVLEKLQAQNNNILILLFTAAALTITVLMIAYKGLSSRSKSLEKKAEKKFNSLVSYKSAQIQASLYTHIGYTTWQESQLSNSEDDRLNKLDFAITSARYAYLCIGKLSYENDASLIGQVKINLAYFLAQRHDANDVKEALALAFEVYELSKTTKTKNWYDWQESCAFVFLQCGDDVQKKHSCMIVKELLCNPAILDSNWRADTKKEWGELLKEEA